jgi:hypothetical protein
MKGTDSPSPGRNGLSIVTVVMNRAAHLMVTAPKVSRWKGHREHLIVDWSSTPPIDPRDLPSDPRIRLLRVEDETRWQLTRAYNFAIAMASFDTILKLDADCWIDSRDSSPPPLMEGGYLRSPLGGGLNGLFLIRRADFFSVGGFNELLRGYGFDDKDLYQRLEKRLVRHPFPPELLRTIEHGDLERVAAATAAGSSRKTRRNAWTALHAIALMEESKGINRLLAERLEWTQQSERSRYRQLDADRWQVVEGSIPLAPRSLEESAAVLGTRIYLSHLLGLPERFLEMRLPAQDLERIRGWGAVLQVQAMFRIATVLPLLKLALLISRKLRVMGSRGAAKD